MNMLRSEHPNPQFCRDSYRSLNGAWRFSAPEVGNREIQVPFCPESVLSGIGYPDFIKECEYRRTFDWTPSEKDERVVLNFGAVDYEARVYINGCFAGEHRGGYTPFGFDIAAYLKDGENEIAVKVRDDVRSNLPSGKQSSRRDSHGCFYSRVTGIWQSVWLERTPKAYVKGIKFFPHVADCSVNVEVCVEGGGETEITVYYDGCEVGKACGNVNYRRNFLIGLTERHLWEPGFGRLYDVTVRCGDDEVKSYFGLREVGFDGYKFKINGKTVFQRFVLDQGYYKDGLYTAPCDEDMINDIALSMRLGFNGARLHQKVFEPRYLYHCDRTGYMVWGEFPSWGVEYDNLEALGAVVGEWTAAVERDFNHPSIITWCPLNETWENLSDAGKVRDVRFVDAVYALTKAIDNTRPCVDVSGGYHGHKTDLYDFHDYLDPETLSKHLQALEYGDVLIMDKIYAPAWAKEEELRYRKGLPLNASEFGGVSFATDGINGWGYRTSAGEQEFAEGYVALASELLACKKLSGFCYTQLYDVEQEQNGIYTYSRRPKFSKHVMDEIADCNRRIAAIEVDESAVEASDNFVGFVGMTAATEK